MALTEVIGDIPPQGIRTNTEIQYTYKQAVITVATSTTISSAVDTEGMIPCGIVTPGTLTGTSITFQGSIDGVTFVPIYKDGAAYSITVAASQYVYVNPLVFLGLRYIKLVSGSAEAANRTLWVVARTS